MNNNQVELPTLAEALTQDTVNLFGDVVLTADYQACFGENPGLFEVIDRSRDKVRIAPIAFIDGKCRRDFAASFWVYRDDVEAYKVGQ